MPISANVVLGPDVKIFQPDLVNLYGCTLGDEAKVGAFVEAQKNVFIGRRCKISSHSFICVGSGAVILGGVTIGEGELLDAGAVVKIADHEIAKSVPARLGRRVPGAQESDRTAG
jgi:acetyltransferase-like isoleucine patch superfamily enzyme